MKHRSLLTALALAASVAACADGSPLGNAPAARPTVPSHLVGSNYVNQNTSATPLSVSI
ncbi:MAG: hypothetical protein JO040_04595, partial [Gemmatimonadetes bacterium]|nr:hypothetical protein [Gemmatimonadota bacterium]